MAECMLEVAGLMKNFGKLQVSYDLNLEVHKGEIHALIGPNGAGKTTLISQVAGWLQPDAGQIYFNGTAITSMQPHKRVMLGLGRTYQITSVFQEFTALDNVAMGVQANSGHSFRFWGNARRDKRLLEPAMRALDMVGLADRADIRAAQLAHGEQRLLELAMALATEPQMLLLDEPMAGMGPEETSQVIAMLQSLRGKITMLLIEHDMDAVFTLADRISVLVYGKNIATGTPSEIRNDEKVRMAYLGEDFEC